MTNNSSFIFIKKMKMNFLKFGDETQTFGKI